MLAARPRDGRDSGGIPCIGRNPEQPSGDLPRLRHPTATHQTGKLFRDASLEQVQAWLQKNASDLFVKPAADEPISRAYDISDIGSRIEHMREIGAVENLMIASFDEGVLRFALLGYYTARDNFLKTDATASSWDKAELARKIVEKTNCIDNEINALKARIDRIAAIHAKSSLLGLARWHHFEPSVAASTPPAADRFGVQFLSVKTLSG